MPLGITVDLGFDWWISTVAGCAVAVVSTAAFLLLRSRGARGIAALLTVEAIGVTIAAPFVMGEMASGARPANMAATGNAMRSGVPDSGSTIIHVIEHAPAPHMQQFGVVTTFTNPLFDRRDVKRVGTDQGFCVHIALAKGSECVWTSVLPGGQITAEGPEPDTGETLLFAITGGTGKYENVRGWGTSTAHNKAGTKFDNIFHLTG